jgi:hypothetical protein
MSGDPTLHNSYKCYDSIPTPSPTVLDESKRASNAHFMHQSLSSNANNNNNNNCVNSASANLLRTASLDSLINSSEQDSHSENDDDEDDNLSDSDSLTELKNICDNNSKNNRSDRDNCCDDRPRKSDIEELTNGIEPPKEPVIKAYLEKCHKKCEYKNCCFKKSNSDAETKKSNNNSPNHQIKSNLSSRRNSIASAVSVSRMETILEEPTEPKVSVKEILARFETLREAAEVNLWCDIIGN